MIKKWIIRKTDPEKQSFLSGELAISPLIAQVLINRGIDTPDKVLDFLKPSLLNLKDPFLMKGMHESVARIKKAIQKKEKIMIHGDYDVDGICATALVVLVTKKLGADVCYYIPDRMQDGYGINDNAIKFAKEKKIKLLITVDCGITAIKQVDALNAIGVDVIVTDHHHAQEKLPNAFSILNPLQKGCGYPHKNLAGVGVAFKLMSALCGEHADDFYQHLDLVCLGTVSDVVPLTGENRIFVKNGLEQLTHSKNKGLQALLSVVKLKGRDMTSHYVGFILGPRINAAGRLHSAKTALDMLLCDDPKKAHDLANSLDLENKSRQKLEQRTLTQALSKLEKNIDFAQDKVIVLHDDKWHIGVIGIVASRLVDKYNRPTLILTNKDDFIKGSGRSIKNFHLVEALDGCSHLLENFGGHSYAAGLTLHKKSLDDFKKTINMIADNNLTPEDFIPNINVDMEIPLGSLSEKFFKELNRLAPFGMGNSKPVFVTRNLKVKTEPQIVGKDTVKMWITDDSATCQAIGFRMADSIPPDIMDKKIDLVYTCNLNIYKGVKSIQLQLKDIRANLQNNAVIKQ